MWWYSFHFSGSGGVSNGTEALNHVWTMSVGSSKEEYGFHLAEPMPPLDQAWKDPSRGIRPHVPRRSFFGYTLPRSRLRSTLPCRERVEQ